MILIPTGWSDLQHYKDRKPHWIKLHTDLLNNFSYSSVSIGTKATLPLLWILACEYEDGIINASIEEISFRIHIDKSTVTKAIDQLLEIGLFTNDTEPYQTVSIDSLEKEKEKEKEEREMLFSFSLKKKTKYDNLSEEYKENLYGACMLIDGKENRYNDFLVACRANGYPYMNFPMAYMKWDETGDYKNFKTKPIPDLGKEWQEVALGKGEVLAVNTVTYETRRGSIS